MSLWRAFLSLSDAKIRALPPSKNQRIHFDETLPGFGVRVSQKGTKTFTLIMGTERKRVSLGRYPLITLAEARQKALGILRDRELGIAAPAPSPPFLDVYQEYMATRDALRPNTRRADVYMLRPFLTLGKQKIADITFRQLDEILKDIKAPISRLHAFSNIRNLFRFAFKRGYIDKNPLDRLTAPKANPPRERVLTDDELRRVLLTARATGHPYGNIVELCVRLGQRRHQIANLRREWVDFEHRTISWPAEAMKGRKRHTIPFGEGALPLLDSYSFAGFSFAHRRFKTDCGVDFGLHDLRRTLATRWQEMGVRIEVTERYLSHSAVTGGLVGIYQRAVFLEPMKAAVQQWEDYLQALLSNTETTNGAELPGLHRERA